MSIGNWAVMGASAVVLAISCGPAFATAPSDAFSYFAGDWHCAGVFPSNGRTISSNLHFDWNADAAALVKRHDDEPPNGYHAVELWAAAKSGELRNTIADPFGGVRYYSSQGWSGDVLAWTNLAEASPKDRFIYTKLDAGTMRVDWAASKDGSTFVVGDTLTCARK
jgi:hypothetical protein